MATRIEIELTSRRDDATFTWRAAGAREPKGVVEASVLPPEAEVGSTFKVEAEVELDGITIVQVVPAKAPKEKQVQTLELIARDDEPLVTQQLAPKSRRDGDRRGGGRRRDGDRPSRRDDGDRPRGGGGGRSDRPRTPAKPKLPPKPKPPRLKAGRTHRGALLDSLPDEQKPVAQELVSGGLNAVRTALAKQNEQRKTEGAAAIDEGPILSLAEKLLHQVRAAEWLDRAEAAIEQSATVDLRDLRSVVTAADGAAKDDEARALAARLRTALNERLDAEHHAWVDEIVALIADDRVVRALHLSSRPPKAGAPLPAAVAVQLVEAANASMTSEISADRWGYVLEALAHSPVRRQVVPASLPTTVTPELKAMIARHGSRLPEIAEIFGIEPDPAAGRGPRRKKRPKTDARKSGDGPKADAPGDAPAPAADEAPAATGAPATDATPAADATPAEDTAPVEVPTADGAPAEVESEAPPAAEVPDAAPAEAAAPEEAAAAPVAEDAAPADAAADDES